MARKLKVSLTTYGRMERGELSNSVKTLVTSRGLKPHERCLLYRKRCGKKQYEVAKDLKMSRYYINQMEIGAAPVDALLWYWEQ